MRDRLLGSFQFCLKFFEIKDDERAAIQANEIFGLEAAEVAGNKFADSTDMRSQFLVTGRQKNLYAAGGRLPFLLGDPNQVRSQAMSDGGEGKLFDNAHQTPQAGAYDSQHLESDL